VFDKMAEDGMRFRIYELGSLEVRTTQAHDGTETVGAVFGRRSASRPLAPDGGGAVDEADGLVRVAQYVEAPRGCVPTAAKGSLLHGPPRFFVVAETRAGGAVIAERVAGAGDQWTEDTGDLERRVALSKVMRSVDTQAAGLLVRDLRRAAAAAGARLGSRAYAEALVGAAQAAARAAEAAAEEAVPAAEPCSLERADQAADAAGAGAGPAWRKPWSALSPDEREAARRLVRAAAGAEQAWDTRAGAVWRSGWQQLSPAERAAAEELGLDRSAWSLMEL